jgi:predicted nucleic acid-binding protein
MIYLDTSAATKLVHSEAESEALAVFLVKRIDIPLVSSALLHPELVRAVARHRPELGVRAIRLLQRTRLVPVAVDILADTATVGDPALRTLDAIHLATAITISQELDSFVCYDKRLGEAAAAQGLTVDAPA